MNAMALMIVAATMGVDYGWHKVADGEWEYIIQIEPALLDTLSKGQALVSQIPPELKGIRRFRIQIGQGEVPREAVPVQGILGAEFTQRTSSPTLPYSLPSGTPANGGFPLMPGNPTLARPPYDVYLARTSSYDWLKANPILVDPLENLLLNPSSGFGNDRLGNPGTNTTWSNPPLRGPNSGTLPIPTNGWSSGQGGTAGAWPNSSFANRPSPTSLRPGENINRTAWGLDQGNQVTAANADADRFDTRTPYDERHPGDPRVTPAQITAHRPGAPFNGPLGAVPPAAGMYPPGPPTFPATYPGPIGALPGALPGNQQTVPHAADDVLGTQIPPTQKIWWPLTTTVVLLFASLGGNFYLGWLAVDFYRRYREAAWELRSSRSNN